MWEGVVAAVLIALVAAFGLKSARYYGRMFSESHFREFHVALAEAIRSAATSEELQRPDADDSARCKSFLTKAGLGAAATFSVHPDGGYDLHISLSQPGRATTHAVGGNFGLFILAMLQGNKAGLTAYFTDSGVRHLSFELASPVVAVQDFETAYASYSEYLRERKTIPFERRNIETMKAYP
jgi:hypothetical protein